MLPFEEDIVSYIETTHNHVMYRVTPIYIGNDALAKYVHMEGLSVEDGGKGISFNILVYNAQPGIEIDYSDGTSHIQ